MTELTEVLALVDAYPEIVRIHRQVRLDPPAAIVHLHLLSADGGFELIQEEPPGSAGRLDRLADALLAAGFGSGPRLSPPVSVTMEEILPESVPGAPAVPDSFTLPLPEEEVNEIPPAGRPKWLRFAARSGFRSVNGPSNRYGVYQRLKYGHDYILRAVAGQDGDVPSVFEVWEYATSDDDLAAGT